MGLETAINQSINKPQFVNPKFYFKNGEHKGPSMHGDARFTTIPLKTYSDQ